jgi:hypothetical protein
VGPAWHPVKAATLLWPVERSAETHQGQKQRQDDDDAVTKSTLGLHV